MTIKSAQTLVQEAYSEVKTISPNDALNLVKENKCNLIDIRDIRELEKEGKVENSVHIPRGMLEFWIDPNSQYFKEGKLDLHKEMVLFCAAGASMFAAGWAAAWGTVCCGAAGDSTAGACWVLRGSGLSQKSIGKRAIL